MHKFTPLHEAIEKIRADYEKVIKSKILEAERTREAYALLEGARLISPNDTVWDGYICIRLGEKIKKRESDNIARKLVAIRKLLGPIKYQGKNLHNSRRKLISVDLQCEKYPEVRLTYITKLPENSTCEIVKRKSRSYVSASLVCSR